MTGELVCDALYLNLLSNFKQWYTPYRKINELKTIGRLNTVIFN